MLDKINSYAVFIGEHTMQKELYRNGFGYYMCNPNIICVNTK